MAKCVTSGENFIRFVYSPCVSLFVSEDANDICLKDNLTFTELLQPFSRLNKSVSLRDSSNLAHTVCNLSIKFLDASVPPPSGETSKANLREIVNACALNNHIPSTRVTNGILSTFVPIKTPWFEAWRYVFIRSLWPNAHEFVDHSLACIIVVSTNHSNPLGELVRISELQYQRERSGESSYPRWFSSNIVKCYVVLHDVSSGDRKRADEVYKQIQNHFGSASCFFLPLFSAGTDVSQSKEFANGGSANHFLSSQSSACDSQSTEDAITSDPWLCHLLPDGFQPIFPQTSLIQTGPMSYPPNHDPLLTSDDSLANGCNSDAEFLARCPFVHARHLKPHGRHLTQEDRETVHQFVYEFVVRCLLPWVEQTMRSLSDQVAHRMRLSRSLLSATRKFFTSAVGGSAQTTATSSTTNATSQPTTLLNSTSTPSFIGMSGSGGNWPPTSSESVMARNSIRDSKEDVSSSPTAHSVASALPVVVYTAEAPEMQMRRLADLAFLFQQYEVAYQTYNVLKRDFQNDAAWLHHAAAQEMAALSIYLQGTTSQRQYPYHYVDSSVTIYLQTCQAAELALRATLVNAEAMCSRGLYAEAAMSLLRLTSQDDDLTSGLLIEQTAHCVLRTRRPMIRKFGFRMVLAAHRFNRAKQSHLTIRTYKVAAPIVTGLRWSLIEDHINFTVGKQAYLIGDLKSSLKALRRNLNQCSRQPAERQSLFVREYLVVLKQLLARTTARDNDSVLVTSYATFPLPLVRVREIKTMLGKPVKHGEDLLFEARGIQFVDVDELKEEQREVDALFLNKTDNHQSNHWSEWMDCTDISDFEDYSPIGATDLKCDDSHFIPNHTPIPSTIIPGLLEQLLGSTIISKEADRKAGPDVFPPRSHSNLFTYSTTSSTNGPVAPVGEYLTVQIPLENPLRIPLVLANLHLLWSFQPESAALQSDQAELPNAVTNETPLDSVPPNRQIIASEVVPELIMLPGESKALDISVLPKQLGQLHITGLCFNWIYPSAQHLGRSPHELVSESVATSLPDHQRINGHIASSMSHTSQLHSNTNDDFIKHIPSTTSGKDLNSVRGKITFVDHIKSTSPNLSSFLPHMMWTITSPAALLKVAFSDFPMKMLQGEVYSLKLSLTNAGSRPLNNLRVASNWLNFIGFQVNGFPGDEESSTEHGTTSTANPSTVVRLKDRPVLPWLNVPLIETLQSSSCRRDTVSHNLAPGASVVIPIWFRAPHLSPSLRRSLVGPSITNRPGCKTSIPDIPLLSEQRTVHMVFQYSSSIPNTSHPELNTRFVRHRSELELQPSLSFKAFGCRNSVTGPNDIFIHLLIRNVTNNTFRNSFDILQVSCASRSWILKPIPTGQMRETDGLVSLAPGEVATLTFRGSLLEPGPFNHNDSSDPSSASDDEPNTYTAFSTVSLTPATDFSSPGIVLPFRSPHVDFYYRSGGVVKRKKTEIGLQTSSVRKGADMNITLIVFWRRCSTANRTEPTSIGQSHVSLTRLDHLVSVPSEHQDNVDQHLGQLTHSSEPLASLPENLLLNISSPTPIFDQSQLVQLRLKHAFNMSHSFPSKTYRSPLSTRSPLALNCASSDVRFDKMFTSPLEPVALRTKNNSLLKVCMDLELFNITRVPILVQIEAALDDNRDFTSNIDDTTFKANLSNLSLQARHARVLWCGLTRKRFFLQPGETRNIALHGRTALPGFFDTNSLIVRAGLASGDSGPQDLIRQSMPPSFLLVDTDKSQFNR